MSTHPRFYEILEDLKKLYEKKNNDYANEDPLSNLRVFGWRGIIVRLNDKYNRLVNFYHGKELKVEDETIVDTFRDNAIYSILGIIMYEEENKNK